MHASKAKVPRFAQWKRPPPVYVSTVAPVSLDDVREACDWITEKTGLKFGAVQGTPLIDTGEDGGIFIFLATELTDNRNAEAIVDFEPSSPEETMEPADLDHDHVSDVEDIVSADAGEIKRAVIRIEPPEPGWDMAILLRHELVHAQGFGHVETAVLGRRKKDSKSGKRKKGDVRRFVGLKLIGRKTGHLMNDRLSLCGDDVSGIKP